jgi:glycosyltransferase involved in cell wall biosynthesis
LTQSASSKLAEGIVHLPQPAHARRLLFVIHYPIFGGPHNQALRLNQPLAALGWEHLVLLPNDPGNAAKRLVEGGVEVVQMPLHRLRATPRLIAHAGYLRGFWREVNAIRSLIRRRSIELVLIGGLANLQGAIAARLERVPIVWQLLDTSTPMLLRRLLMPVVTRLAGSLMTTGEFVARAHPGATCMGERVFTYFPPVDVDVFRPDPMKKSAARAELRLTRDDLVVGNVSNVNPDKGHATFIRAAAALRRKFPRARFVIMGATYSNHSAYAEGLWRLAESLGLGVGRDLLVRDPGSRVAELAQALDVFWLTSRAEGMPTVVEEAMALGIPVVAVDVGSVREAVQDGTTGFVVPALEPERLAGATAAILDDSALRSAMSSASRRRAIQYFNLGMCAESHARAFATALSYRDAPGSPARRSRDDARAGP